MKLNKNLIKRNIHSSTYKLYPLNHFHNNAHIVPHHKFSNQEQYDESSANLSCCTKLPSLSYNIDID